MKINAKELIERMLADSIEPEAESGVYALVNTVNKRVYIGCAANVRSRLQDHRRKLRAQKHPNELLRMDCAEHGPDAFVGGALLLCPTWDRFHFEAVITRQLIGPSCYNWSPHGQKSVIAGHPAMPTLGRCW